MCPPSFIEIASKEEWNLTNLYYYYYYCAYNNNSEDETTDPIPLLGEWDNNNNKEDKIQRKIPFPFRENGIIITRGTVPRGTVDPIPNGLSLWPRTMFRQVTPSHDHCSAPPLYRHVWDNCQTGIIARVALSRGWCSGPSSDVVNFPNYVTIHLAWTPR